MMMIMKVNMVVVDTDTVEEGIAVILMDHTPQDIEITEATTMEIEEEDPITTIGPDTMTNHITLTDGVTPMAIKMDHTLTDMATTQADMEDTEMVTIEFQRAHQAMRARKMHTISILLKDQEMLKEELKCEEKEDLITGITEEHIYQKMGKDMEEYIENI